MILRNKSFEIREECARRKIEKFRFRDRKSEGHASRGAHVALAPLAYVPLKIDLHILPTRAFFRAAAFK